MINLSGKDLSGLARGEKIFALNNGVEKCQACGKSSTSDEVLDCYGCGKEIGECCQNGLESGESSHVWCNACFPKRDMTRFPNSLQNDTPGLSRGREVFALINTLENRNPPHDKHTKEEVSRDGRSFGTVTQAECPNESALRRKMVSVGAMTDEEAKTAKFYVADKGVGFEIKGGGDVFIRCYGDCCYNSLENAADDRPPMKLECKDCEYKWTSTASSTSDKQGRCPKCDSNRVVDLEKQNAESETPRNPARISEATGSKAHSITEAHEAERLVKELELNLASNHDSDPAYAREISRQLDAAKAVLSKKKAELTSAVVELKNLAVDEGGPLAEVIGGVEDAVYNSGSMCKCGHGQDKHKWNSGGSYCRAVDCDCANYRGTAGKIEGADFNVGDTVSYRDAKWRVDKKSEVDTYGRQWWNLKWISGEENVGDHHQGAPGTKMRKNDKKRDLVKDHRSGDDTATKGECQKKHAADGGVCWKEPGHKEQHNCSLCSELHNADDIKCARCNHTEAAHGGSTCGACAASKSSTANHAFEAMKQNAVCDKCGNDHDVSQACYPHDVFDNAKLGVARGAAKYGTVKNADDLKDGDHVKINDKAGQYVGRRGVVVTANGLMGKVYVQLNGIRDTIGFDKSCVDKV